MSNRFASGKHSIAECDRCGFRYKLKDLKTLIIKTKNVNILVCNSCWEEDHPQLQLGMYPVDDPQAVRNPRPDTSYLVSGVGGDTGSRIIQWGWGPVGFDEQATGVPSNLVGRSALGHVTVSAEFNPITVVPVNGVVGTGVVGDVFVTAGFFATVLSSDGTDYGVTNIVNDSSGGAYAVAVDVLSSNGTPYNPI